jgi:hypothetical protein
MDDEFRDRVRRRAYEIWEREGFPEGREGDHWLAAEQEIVHEEAEPSPVADLGIRDDIAGADEAAVEQFGADQVADAPEAAASLASGKPGRRPKAG